MVEEGRPFLDSYFVLLLVYLHLTHLAFLPNLKKHSLRAQNSPFNDINYLMTGERAEAVLVLFYHLAMEYRERHKDFPFAVIARTARNCKQNHRSFVDNSFAVDSEVTAGVHSRHQIPPDNFSSTQWNSADLGLNFFHRNSRLCCIQELDRVARKIE